MAPTTTARKLAALRALFSSQREHGRIAQNPADLVSTPRRPSHLPRVLSARDTAQLLDGIPGGSPLELRDRALFELAYSCGLRAEEMVSLKTSDVDHDAEQLRVEGKGRKTRILPAGEPALAAVALPRARPPGARGARRRRGRPVPVQERPAARHERRPAQAQKVDRQGGGGQRILAARAPTQLRDAPAGRRRRSAQHPGAAGPRERVEHPDLHSGRVRPAETRVCAQSPSGLNRGGNTLETNVKPIELRELWRRYKTDGDSRVRERLVVAYSPLVKYVAGRTAAGLPPHVEEADLISYGLVGLISAIERFDLSRDIKFETYAIMRIKGAIIDELRSMDWVPRSVRSRAREVERANAKLENTLQRAPTDEEIAAEMGITVDELNDSLLAISHSSMVALDELWSVSDSSGDQVSLMDTIEDPGAPDPARALDVGDLKDRIAESIAKLPEREKLVIALYYYENLTLREIGEVLGVTESRVSQMHTKAVLRLRSRMQEESFDD